jgi:hypothetical protein
MLVIAAKAVAVGEVLRPEVQGAVAGIDLRRRSGFGFRRRGLVEASLPRVRPPLDRRAPSP